MNPIILAYDGSHYDTISENDDTNAIDLVHSVKVGDYTLAKEDIPNIKRISKNTQKNPRERARSKKWNITTHTNMNARGCINTYKIKTELTHHIRQSHKHNNCLTCISHCGETEH